MTSHFDVISTLEFSTKTHSLALLILFVGSFYDGVHLRVNTVYASSCFVAKRICSLNGVHLIVSKVLFLHRVGLKFNC